MDRTSDPTEILRGALEKIVFFECRVAQLEAELRAATQTATRASADASGSHRRAVELEAALAGARGAREESERRAEELAERVRLLEGERERLLGGLVEQAGLAGAPAAEGDAGGDQADLAGFISELRGELEELRRFKERATRPEGPSPSPAGGAGAAPRARPAPDREGARPTVGALADRLAAAGRAGLTPGDAGALRAQLATESDRMLFEEAVEKLRAAQPASRLRAVRRLEALGARAAAPLLAAALGREPDEAVKIAMLGALARVEEPFAAEVTAHALQDPRPAVRAAALDAFSRLAAERAEPCVHASLGDESAIVRRRAALLLGFSRGSEADEALAAALRDPDPGVARAAAAALAGRPSARAQQALARALEHAEPRVRRSAAETLGRWSGERVDGDAPDHERRRAARRITERLAAMAPAEVRSAVVAAADRPRRSELVVHRFTKGGPVRAAVEASTRRPSAPPPAERARARGAPAPAGRRVASGSPAASTAVAVVERAAAVASAAPGVEGAVIAELRGALRGRTAAELAGILGAPAEALEAALGALSGRGEIVARGARWYVG